MEDSVSRCMRLILSDDRRKPDDAEAVEKYWRKEFASVVGDDLEGAVRIWLRENPRGRPNVGKIHEILNRSKPALSRKEEAKADDRRRELIWAVSVLEAPYRYAKYQSTLGYAEKCLRAQGFQTWQDAKSHLSPGWSQGVGEAYL